jgi:hypothetical protein
MANGKGGNQRHFKAVNVDEHVHVNVDGFSVKLPHLFDTVAF